MRRWRVPAAGCVVGLVLVAAYVFGVHQPRSARIDDLAADREQLRAQQAVLRREIAVLEEVATRQSELERALQVLEQLIPPGLDQPRVLGQLQAAADEVGVALVSVTFGDPRVPDGLPESRVPDTVLVAVPVTVVVEGGFREIVGLLDRVEGGIDRALLVGTVALTEADEGFPRLTGTWSGQAYALLPPSDPLVAGIRPPTPPAAEPAPTSGRAGTNG